MFDSLDERIRRDDAVARTAMGRWLQVAGVLAIAIALFVVLYLVVEFMQ